MFMKNAPALILIFCLIIFSACDNSRKKEEKDAVSRLEKVRDYINNNALNQARIELDSIHILYPRLVDKRKTAAELTDTILRIENVRTLAYCDSILPIKQYQLDSIRKNFNFEKNADYQTTGNYIYKTLRIESNIDRIYLRAHVDENADFFLVSSYTGSYKINHTSLKASVNEIFSETENIPVESAMNHSFDNNGVYYEIVTFKNEAAGNIPVFITQFAGDRIKLTLQGSKTYNYYLTDSDKKALAETYNLWVAAKDVQRLELEIKKAQNTINAIDQRSAMGTIVSE